MIFSVTCTVSAGAATDAIPATPTIAFPVLSISSTLPQTTTGTALIFLDYDIFISLQIIELSFRKKKSITITSYEKKVNHQHQQTKAVAGFTGTPEAAT